MAKERATATFKIGGDEIRFEASREAVEAQVEKVMARLLDRGAAVDGVSVGVKEPNADAPPVATAPTVPAPAEETKPPANEMKPPASDAGWIEELYGVNAEGMLLMSRTPKAPVDVLLLVLYGTGKVQDSPWVSAPMLMKTAREAGARFERGDRVLAKRSTLIQAKGQARGKYYRLTTKGEEHCRRLIRDLFAGDEGAH